MRRLFLTVMMLLLSCSLSYAEATFDQIQGLIKSQDYAAAIQGLNVIIQNHPRSAKAYYAMSQAQAGVGNQAKAKEALDMAKGLDPALKFAPSGSVKNLKEAIEPQTKKIEAIESHTLRNTIIFLLVAGIVAFFVCRRKKEDPTADAEKVQPPTCDPPQGNMLGQQNAYAALSAMAPIRRDRPGFQARPMYTPPPAPVHHTTVVNNSGGSDLVAGMVIGNMLAGSHHEQRTVVEREYVREVAPTREVEREEPRSSSWDDDKPSSTWDSGLSSSSASSSWDSSSGSSSSWDSGSSDSSSSSSWD